MEEIVTIVIPLHNTRPEWFASCLKSVTAQTYGGTRVIVINDGSEAALTAEYEKLFEGIDPQKAVLHTIPNQGVSHARNYGVDLAEDGWICFVDSDDYVDANFVEELLKMVQQTGCDMGCCDHRILKAGKLLEEGTPLPEAYQVFEGQELFEKADCLYIWDKIYRRELLLETRFILGKKTMQDVLFLNELLSKHPRMACTGKRLYNYRVSLENVSKTKKKVDFLREINDMQGILESPYVKASTVATAHMYGIMARKFMLMEIAALDEAEPGWREELESFRKRYGTIRELYKKNNKMLKIYDAIASVSGPVHELGIRALSVSKKWNDQKLRKQ